MESENQVEQNKRDNIQSIILIGKNGKSNSVENINLIDFNKIKSYIINASYSVCWNILNGIIAIFDKYLSKLLKDIVVLKQSFKNKKKKIENEDKAKKNLEKLAAEMIGKQEIESKDLRNGGWDDKKVNINEGINHNMSMMNEGKSIDNFRANVQSVNKSHNISMLVDNNKSEVKDKPFVSNNIYDTNNNLENDYININTNFNDGNYENFFSNKKENVLNDIIEKVKNGNNDVELWKEDESKSNNKSFNDRDMFEKKNFSERKNKLKEKNEIQVPKIGKEEINEMIENLKKTKNITEKKVTTNKPTTKLIFDEEIVNRTVISEIDNSENNASKKGKESKSKKRILNKYNSNINNDSTFDATRINADNINSKSGLTSKISKISNNNSTYELETNTIDSIESIGFNYMINRKFAHNIEVQEILEDCKNLLIESNVFNGLEVKERYNFAYNYSNLNICNLFINNNSNIANLTTTNAISEDAEDDVPKTISKSSTSDFKKEVFRHMSSSKVGINSSFNKNDFTIKEVFENTKLLNNINNNYKNLIDIDNTIFEEDTLVNPITSLPPQQNKLKFDIAGIDNNIQENIVEENNNIQNILNDTNTDLKELNMIKKENEDFSKINTVFNDFFSKKKLKNTDMIDLYNEFAKDDNLSKTNFNNMLPKEKFVSFFYNLMLSSNSIDSKKEIKLTQDKILSNNVTITKS